MIEPPIWLPVQVHQGKRMFVNVRNVLWIGETPMEDEQDRHGVIAVPGVEPVGVTESLPDLKRRVDALLGVVE